MSESLWDLESKVVYSIIVAGKSAKFADQAVAKLMEECFLPSPLDFLAFLDAKGLLAEYLKKARTGNYTKTEKSIKGLILAKKAGLDLSSCKPADLEAIHGIGPKTSRFFIMWTRPNERYAALDVHVLRWMRNLGYDAPKSTPSSGKYAELEKAFIAEADKRGKTSRELDWEIWSAQGRSNNAPPEKKS